MFLFLKRRRYFIITILTASSYVFLVWIYFFEGELSSDYVDSEVDIVLGKPQNQSRHFNIEVFEKTYISLAHETHKQSTQSKVKITSSINEKENGIKKYSFNEQESSRIGAQRKIPDNRSPECFFIQYPSMLPSASVIIIFHNEAWSTLLRTINSVLTRSPPAFLEEIILVDDSSETLHDFVHLGAQLDEYLRPLKKVRLLRSLQREGIVKSRLRGAQIAKGKVLVFLDSHCEANYGWLEPLLSRIFENEKHVVTPDIEIIDYKTFEYSVKREPSIGVFNWNMLFKWRKMTREEKEMETMALPLRSPTMAGGLFAMSKKFFYELGSYDNEMSFWGGENLEISFRIWMCGGTIEIIPCSKVGHVFRDKMPYTTPKGTTERNIKRIVDVWMDDYKSIVYSLKPTSFQFIDSGDISSRIELREKLQCKSFAWYLQNIIPELAYPDLYPIGRGEIRNLRTGLCLDTLGHNVRTGKLGATGCHGMRGNQLFIYSKNLELWHDELCVGTDIPQVGKKVEFFKCNSGKRFYNWEHSRGEMIRLRDSNLCLELRGVEITLQICNNASNQQWIFSSYPYHESVQKRH